VPTISFPQVPDQARVWVFGASQPVLGSDADRLLTGVDAFLRGWHAHGIPVVGSRDWVYDRFLMVAADEEASGVSGCSIDALFRTLKAGEGALGVTLLDSSLVFYRDTEAAIQCASRGEFRELVTVGEVIGETIVFDNTVGRVGGVRRGEWERPLRESWHARAFRR
jgi:hypothetical protein